MTNEATADESAEPAGGPAVAAFQQLVLGRPDLLEALASLTDPDAFVDACMTEGRRHGIAFAPDDVRSAMRAGRRAWTESLEP